MDRQLYLDLAASGMRMPIGTDLVLRSHDDAEAILVDGRRLGAVVEEAAMRYHTPIAIPLMDLMVEKEALARMLGVPDDEVPTYHFTSAPGPAASVAVDQGTQQPLTPRIQANVDAIAYVAKNPKLVPVGMSIGPFSLMTKLVADPIGPVYMSGAGVTAEEDPEVLMVEQALKLASRIIEWSIAAQIAAGARAVIVCEPAANRVYLSPKQIARGSDVFERFVMLPNRQLKAQLDDAGVDLILHDCGELMDEMVGQLASLDPVMMSLGSSRLLWEDAARVPNHIVLYGNLPTKRFYANDLTVADVERMACEMLTKMKATGHPFILGSECDVLSVPEARTAIEEKVDTFLRCPCI